MSKQCPRSSIERYACIDAGAEAWLAGIAPAMNATLRVLCATGAPIGILIAVYAPTFAIVRLLHVRIAQEVPAIILISLFFAALLIIALRAWARFSWADFGFCRADRRYVGWAFVVGVPLALGLTWLDHRYTTSGPLAGLSLPVWKLLVYFAIGAPIQEETIFRGVMQGAAMRGSVVLRCGRAAISGATLFVAAIFGLVHFEVSVVTAIAAFVLGLAAGELRYRSGSLIPAIIAHALFNLGSFFWSV